MSLQERDELQRTNEISQADGSGSVIGAGVCSQVDALHHSSELGGLSVGRQVAALHHSSGLGGPSLGRGQRTEWLQRTGTDWHGHLKMEVAIVQAFPAHETWHESQFHTGPDAMETSKERVTCRLRDQSLAVGRTTEATNEKRQVEPGNTIQAGIGSQADRSGSVVGAGVCSQVDALHHSSELGGPSLGRQVAALHHSSGLGGPSLGRGQRTEWLQRTGTDWHGHLKMEVAIVQAFLAHETWHESQFHTGLDAMETSKERVTCRLRDQSLAVGRTTEATNERQRVQPGNTIQAGIGSQADGSGSVIGAGVCSQVDALHHSSGLGGPSLGRGQRAEWLQRTGTDWRGHLKMEVAIVQAFPAHETWHQSQFHTGPDAMGTGKERVTCRLRDQSLAVGRTTEATNERQRVEPGNTIQAGIGSQADGSGSVIGAGVCSQVDALHHSSELGGPSLGRGQRAEWLQRTGTDWRGHLKMEVAIVQAFPAHDTWHQSQFHTGPDAMGKEPRLRDQSLAVGRTTEATNDKRRVDSGRHWQSGGWIRQCGWSRRLQSGGCTAPLQRARRAQPGTSGGCTAPLQRARMAQPGQRATR